MSTQQKVSRQKRALAQRELELEALEWIVALPEDDRPVNIPNARLNFWTWEQKLERARADVANLRRKLGAVPQEAQQS